MTESTTPVEDELKHITEVLKVTLDVMAAVEEAIAGVRNDLIAVLNDQGMDVDIADSIMATAVVLNGLKKAQKIHE